MSGSDETVRVYYGAGPKLDLYVVVNVNIGEYRGGNCSHLSPGKESDWSEEGMAVTCEIDTLQGIINGMFWFHQDLSNDVIYLRVASMRDMSVYGEETPEGFTLLRTETGEVAGITIVNYWKHFGTGSLTAATIQTLKSRVEQWVRYHLLAA